MSILFGRGDWKTRANFIYNATKQHATNLARFVTIYKTALLLQRRVLNGGKQKSSDTFLAGLIGGWFVFSKRNAVNEQVRSCPGLASGSPCDIAHRSSSTCSLESLPPSSLAPLPHRNLLRQRPHTPSRATASLSLILPATLTRNRARQTARFSKLTPRSHGVPSCGCSPSVGRPCTVVWLTRCRCVRSSRARLWFVLRRRAQYLYLVRDHDATSIALTELSCRTRKYGTDSKLSCGVHLVSLSSLGCYAHPLADNR